MFQVNGSSTVIDLTAFPMPAVGKTVYSKMSYNTASVCGFMELYAYQEWAAFQYSILTGSNATISKFQRRLVLMPNNNCQFYGSGAQGCLGPYCYVWIRGDRSVASTCCNNISPPFIKRSFFMPGQRYSALSFTSSATLKTCHTPATVSGRMEIVHVPWAAPLIEREL